MVKKHRIGRIVLVLVGLVGLGFAARAVHQTDNTPRAAAETSAAGRGAVVETARVRRARLPDEVSAVGTLKSNESVVLRPETSGRIEKIHFGDGAEVRTGSLLINLDAGIQAAELQQAQANLALAQANQRRNEDLFQKKFISQQSLDNTRAALKVQEANVALAVARLAKTRIRAPFDGVVGIRTVSVGDYVREGEELINLEDIQTLKVDFRLPEAYLNRLARGLTLEVTSDALPAARLQATLAAIDPLVDANGRSVSCRALLANREGQLRPGMFVRVRLSFGARENVLMVPDEAVVTGSQPQVFRVEAGQVKAVPVRLGQHLGGQVEVLEGLQEGDAVVVSGQLKIRDGQAVTATDSAQAAPPEANAAQKTGQAEKRSPPSPSPV